MFTSIVDASIDQIEAYEELVTKVAKSVGKHMLDNTDGAVYVAMRQPDLPLLHQRFVTMGGHWSNTIVCYDPSVGALDDILYPDATIPVLYGWRDGVAHSFYGGRDQGNVWKLPEPSPGHLPVSVVVKCLLNSSRAGEKMSSATESSRAVTSCGTSPGTIQESPGDSSRSRSPRTKRSLPETR